MPKLKKLKNKNRNNEIAKVIVAILFLGLILWLTPLFGALLRPYVHMPLPVTQASEELVEYKKLVSYLTQYGFDDISIDYLIDMKIKNKDSFVYPKLGIKSPLTMTDTDPTQVRDWKIVRDNLTHGVSASYGKGANNESTLYIIGHSSDYNVLNQYASVFAPIGQAQTGDRMAILKDSNIYIYQIIDDTIIQPNDVSTFQAYGEQVIANRDQVVLVTCWPILTTQSRLLVRGVGEATIPAE